MPLNYYLYKTMDNPIHIGQSTYGWCFALHVYPEKGINTFDDWKEILEQDSAEIKDEYDNIIPLVNLLNVITSRKDGHWCSIGRTPSRHNIIEGNPSIGSGKGSWDYFTGEFREFNY